MIKYDKLFEEWDMLPEIQNVVGSYLNLYTYLKFQNLNWRYYNKYKASNHERTEKFIKYFRLISGRCRSMNDFLRDFVFVMKVIEYNGFNSEFIIKRLGINETLDILNFFLYNLEMNGNPYNCKNCDSNAYYRKVYYKDYEYECCACKTPLKYGIKDFLFDFKDQLKWHKDNCYILKDDISKIEF